MSLSASFARIVAVMVKESIQMRRDRLTFAMIMGIPVLQLVLFGFAINTDPKQLPTAVHLEESTPLIRSILQGMESSGYFRFIKPSSNPRDSQDLLARGEVAFVVSVPIGFTRALIRGEKPQLLIEADASDPAASSNAISNLDRIIRQSLSHEFQGALSYLQTPSAPFELVIHRKYNPEGITQFNIVPGLLGVILTMTMVMITSVAMTRETERGTMENLLAMPARPLEVMIGKITPYIAMGLLQTAIVLLAARYLFGVPFVGSLPLLIGSVGLFILTNLCLGFTFSTLVGTQMQAMQLTFFFFLPSILLSGFMFPFRGMPDWAQIIGEVLPLTHFLRIVRGIMLKDATALNLLQDYGALVLFMLVMGIIAIKRYRQTLD